LIEHKISQANGYHTETNQGGGNVQASNGYNYQLAAGDDCAGDARDSEFEKY
jgi:hypothetical protein